MNVKRALEMLQAELWLAVSMRRKKKEKSSGLFSSASPSPLSHGLIFFSHFMHLFVCLAVLLPNLVLHLLQFSLLEEPGNQSNVSGSAFIGCFSFHAGKWLDSV